MKITRSLVNIWTSSYHTILILLMSLVTPAVLQAQDDSSQIRPSVLTEEFESVKDIRQAQRRLSSNAGVRLFEFDKDGRSVSNLQDVPPELAGLEVINDRELFNSAMPVIYKYYGFTGTETLEFSYKQEFMGEMRYVFVQYINGIETPSYFTISVDPRSQRIIGVSGGLDIDRGYDTQPAIDEREAIDLVIDFILTEVESGSTLYDTDLRDAIRSKVVYVRWDAKLGLQPAWQIEIPFINRVDLKSAFKQFTVNPDGTIQYNTGMDGMTVRVCDGTGASGEPYCGSTGRSTKIHAGGACAFGVVCNGTPITRRFMSEHSM